MPIDKKGEYKYVTITVRKEMIIRLDNMLKKIKKYGNRSEFITDAINEKIERLEHGNK